MDVESLVLEFRSKTDQAQRGINSIDKQLGAFQKTALKASTALTNMAKGLAVGAVVAFGAAALNAAKKSIELADSLKDVADIVGVSTDALQGWRFAAEQNASSADTFDVALKKLVKSVGEARAGNDAMRESFRRLGMEDLIDSGAKTEEIVNRLANALRATKDPAVAAALATDLLGKNAIELIPVLSEGERGLKAYGEQLKQSGGHMSRETVKELAAMADETKKTVAAFDKMASDIALAGMRSALGIKIAVDYSIKQLQRLAVLYTHGLRGVAALENKWLMDQGRANERKHSQAKHGNRTPFVPGVTTTPPPPDLASGGTTRDDAAAAIEREQAAIKDLIADLQFEHSIIGQTAEQQAVMNNLRQLGSSATEEQRVQVEAWTRRNFEAAEALQKVAELEAFAKDVRQQYGDGTEQLTLKVQMLNDALARGLINAQQYGDALEDALKPQELRDLEASWKEIGDRAKEGLADTLVEVAFNTDKAAESMKAFGEEILKAIAKMLILKAIEAGVNAIFGGPSIEGRASGGPVSAGTPYVVGEKRPELFVPNTDGFIMPRIPDVGEMVGRGGGQQRGGGGSPIVINSVVHAGGVNRAEFQQVLNARDARLIPLIMNAVDDKSRRSSKYLTKR